MGERTHFGEKYVPAGNSYRFQIYREKLQRNYYKMCKILNSCYTIPFVLPILTSSCSFNVQSEAKRFSQSFPSKVTSHLSTCRNSELLSTNLCSNPSVTGDEADQRANLLAHEEKDSIELITNVWRDTNESEIPVETIGIPFRN